MIKADLVFTDPPYGMKKENEGVLNDNLNFDDLLEFNKKWIPLTFEPIRAYLEAEAKKVGLTAPKLKEICGVGMYSHWFTKSQFGIIPEQHYLKLQAYYNGEAFALPYNNLQSLFNAEETNRNCRMMELDEKYCDVIIKRWETMTGEKAELVTGEAI